VEKNLKLLLKFFLQKIFLQSELQLRIIYELYLIVVYTLLVTEAQFQEQVEDTSLWKRCLWLVNFHLLIIEVHPNIEMQVNSRQLVKIIKCLVNIC
jgi:hypothetical protein